MGAVINIILAIFVVTNLSSIESYRILGIFPLNGKSNDGMLNALMKGLAKRGHKVDVITHFPPKNPPPNYKVLVNLNGTVEQMTNNLTIDFVKSFSPNPTYTLATKYGNDLCALMGLEEIQEIIKNPPKNPRYDLVIIHALAANCFMGFGHILKVPVVAVSTSMELPWITHFIGNNDNLAFVPNMFILEFNKTNFWHRLKNVFIYYWYVYLFHTLTEKPQTDAMRKYLDPNIPNIRDVERNVALMLVNRHPVVYGTKPITSSLIETSALHIEENLPKLSPELQKWLDEGSDGVVYFTFGSMVLIETLPTNTILDIYKSFLKLAPVRVIMKIANKDKLPPGLPQNVITAPWIPQQAVLNHKNVRVFITHGGLMGCQEALYFGVPLIGVPLFSDQPRNIMNFVEKNMAVLIDFNNLTSSSLNEALDKVLNNPDYRKNAKFYSKLFKDRPAKAMETANFWIEYVIRNGPDALRSPALELYWWQLALLDVYGFVLLCIVLAIALAYFFTEWQLKICFSKSHKKLKRQ